MSLLCTLEYNLPCDEGVFELEALLQCLWKLQRFVNIALHLEIRILYEMSGCIELNMSLVRKMGFSLHEKGRE